MMEGPSSGDRALISCSRHLPTPGLEGWWAKLLVSPQPHAALHLEQSRAGGRCSHQSPRHLEPENLAAVN